MAERDTVTRFNAEIARLIKNSPPIVLAEGLAKRGKGQISTFHEEYAKVLQSLNENEVAELLSRQGGGEVAWWDDNNNNNNPKQN